jgi:hypothetical protein
MPSLRTALVVGVPQNLPGVPAYRSLVNLGLGRVCVQILDSAPGPPGAGEFLKADTVGGAVPAGDGGVWDSRATGWTGPVRVEVFVAGGDLAREEF